MEMTFPHFAPRQDSDNQSGYQTILAALIARQANSQTVRAVRRAERRAQAGGNDAEQRIDYFAHSAAQKTEVCGAFWRNSGVQSNCESGVYQAGSTNVKVRSLDGVGTGEQLNHAGYGALRKL